MHLHRTKSVCGRFMRAFKRICTTTSNLYNRFIRFSKRICTTP